MIDDQFKRVEDVTFELFKDAIETPRVKALGHPLRKNTNNPVKAILNEDTDTPGMVWVHEIGEDAATSFAMVLNSGIGKLGDDELIYGTPVKILKDSIYGLADYEAAEYLEGVSVRPQRSIKISQLDIGLLKPTNPPSMSVILSEATYVIGSAVHRVNDMSITFSSITPNVDEATPVMISIDPTTGIVTLTEGDTFVYLPDVRHPDHRDAFVPFYSKVVPSGGHLCGWVRIYDGQEAIELFDIFAAQEILNKGSSGVPVIACGGQVRTSDGSLVVRG